ncbi:MAG: hypothetical protein M1827_005268 [Pycnora praestabilis]|nr:MAG: hypothetical protein M1827_005268 [Pycnora praestabilis]
MLSKFVATATLVAGLAISSVSAISNITAVGSKFFTGDGNQFFIKGVAYQLTDDDPLTDGNQCQLDASLMKTLGANTIRVYHVDPTADHSACMTAFANAGIYLFVDLDTFTTAITQDDPHWNQTQLTAFEKVLDEFQQYDNTAGVFVGNEILTMPNGSDAAPYIKAAARDVKAYRDSKGYRPVPVGYSAADIAALRPMLQNYVACGTNSSENLDFFSLNAYEWCGDSSYTASGYSQLEMNATSYPIPIFLSETGCNTNPPRTFQDQVAIFDPTDMGQTWSGAIIYEWIEETNNYGLVSYGATVAATATQGVGGFIRSGTPMPVSPDFSNLQSVWSSVSPSAVQMSAYSPSNTPPPCPAMTSGIWLVDGNVKLPTLGQSGNVATSATAAPTGSGTGTATGSAASATATKKSSASGGKEIVGMSVGLAGVMLAFVWWL